MENFFDPLSDEAIQASFGSWKSDVTPKNGEVPEPRQPRPRPPLIAGHTSFRPYVEPILKPRPPEWGETKGPLYNPFEKPYEPRVHKDLQIFDGPGAGYQQRIITPSMSSTKDLFRQETEIVEKDTLKEMLPPDGKIEDYLPAIQWAIKLTTWSHKAEIKCKKLYTKLKKQAKKWLGKDELDVLTPKYSEYESVKPEDMWYPQVSPEIEREYQKSIEEALSNPGKSPADTWASVQKLSDRDVNAPIYDRPLSEEIRQNLKTAYKELETVLRDYKSLGLLQFKGSSRNLKTKEVTRNWAQLYDIFTHTSLEVYKNTALVNDLPWVLADHSNLHRQIQGLPTSILVKLPFLPDLNDTSFTGTEDFCSKLATSLVAAKDYLSDIEQRYIQDSVCPLSGEEHTKVASFRQRMHRILVGKKYIFSPPASFPGPSFLVEDLLQIPASVVLKIMDGTREPVANPNLSPEMVTVMAQMMQMTGHSGLASLLIPPPYDEMTDQQLLDFAKDEYYSYLKNLESSINRITGHEDSNVG